MNRNKNRINSIKMLSILAILILTIGTAYAATTIESAIQSLQNDKYTGCVATYDSSIAKKGTLYYVKQGSYPSSGCKTNDYQINIYDRVYINRIITTINGKLNDLYTKTGSISNQIQDIYNRITNLEDNQNQYENHIAGDYRGFYFTPTQPMQTVATYTFYLPEDSYIYTQTSGSVSNLNQPMYIALGIDDRPCGDYWCYVDKFRQLPNLLQYAGYEISNAGYLTAGYHTLYLDAGWSFSTESAYLTIHPTIITSKQTLDTYIGTLSTGGITNKLPTNLTKNRNSYKNGPKVIYNPKDKKITIEK